MKATVKRVRIWDGDGNDGFGDAVTAFIAKVALVESRDGVHELTIISPQAGRDTIEDCRVVVFASGIIVEAAWKEFVRKTEFDGKGHALDAAGRFAAYLNDEEAPAPQIGAPTPYS